MLPPIPTPSRSSSRASVRTTATSASTSATSSTTTAAHRHNALVGATLAFHRAPDTALTASSITAGPSARRNGALAAATSSATLPSSSGQRGQNTQFSAQASHTAGYHPVRETGSMSSTSSLSVPKRTNNLRGTSPSQQAAEQAAVLAAARAQPHEHPRPVPRSQNVKKLPVPPKPRSLSIQHGDAAVEQTSIPSTNTLVDLYEQHSKQAQPPKSRVGDDAKNESSLSLRDPKSGTEMRGRTGEKIPRSGITSMFSMELSEARGNSRAKDERPKSTEVEALDTHDGHSDSRGSFALASEELNQNNPISSGVSYLKLDDRPSANAILPASTEHYDRSDSKNETGSLPGKTPFSDKPILVRKASAGQTHEHSLDPTSASKPITIQARHANIAFAENSLRDKDSSHDAVSTFSSSSLRSIPAQYNQAYPRRMTPLTTGEDLANALVASSLASSRAASPARLEVPLGASFKKKSQHSKFSFSRTPSPAKSGMLHTLRKEDSSSESDDDDHHPYRKHKKKRLVRKHPNKHHEGDRKRWRDAVTERERKRYEGVWAANRGLHYSFTYEEQELFKRSPTHQRTLQTKSAIHEQVSNIVTREIWSRSRLPETILEVVWDLVDNSSVGRLQKDEFVVGMWLIDQRLKGRKLPVKVSETVWASVRGINGIKVRK